MEQADGGVLARLRGPEGVEAVECDYVVDCDGAAGISRSFTRLDFRARKTGVAIRQVDCRLEWRRLSTMDQMWLFSFEGGVSAVVPLPGGVHRILMIEPEGNFPAREPTLPELQAKPREVARDPTARLADPLWSSYTDLSMGIAPSLRDGRTSWPATSATRSCPTGGRG